MLRLTGAQEFAERWTKKLSGGQAQRARVAVAIFATHYLEEADAFADRIVLIARGRVALGPGNASPRRSGVPPCPTGGRGPRATW